MVKFSIEGCNCKETKALPVGRRRPINSMGWHVPINSMHVMSWSHLCLKPPSMSHAQPYVRVAHTRRLYTKVWPRHYVPLLFSYITHTHTHIRPHTHSLCIVSQEPLVRLSLNFVCIWSVTRRSNHIKTSSWYEAILVMQMKVKRKIFLCFIC